MQIIDQLTPIRRMAVAGSVRTGRIVAITSGKGGVGKSNIALNLAMALRQQGKSVALFDADIRLSNVDLLLGKTPQYSFQDVLLGSRSLNDVMLVDVSGIHIISAAGTDMTDLEDVVKDRFLKAVFQLTQNYDFIIIDTSAGLSEMMVDFALRADEVVVVTTPEPTAVNDAYALVKVLSGLKRSLPFKTLVNLVQSEDEAEEVYERFSLVTQHFLNVTPDYLGFLMEDTNVRSAVRQQDPFIRSFPKCQASKCIQSIAEKLI